MNSLIEVIKISKVFKAKSSAGRNLLRLKRTVCQTADYGAFHAKILTVFLPRFSRFFGLLSSRILQNNLLDLYSVEIRRYKLSFSAKAAASDRHIS